MADDHDGIVHGVVEIVWRTHIWMMTSTYKM